jgi:hypothetical protein
MKPTMKTALTIMIILFVNALLISLAVTAATTNHGPRGDTQAMGAASQATDIGTIRQKRLSIIVGNAMNSTSVQAW